MKNVSFLKPDNLTRSLGVLALLAAASLPQSASAATGTWTSQSNGLWSDEENWALGVVADGASNTANFNTVDLLGDVTVSLDSARTIGNLIFGDSSTGSAGGWTLDNGGNAANVLTLAVGSGNPTITVNSLGAGKVATISLSLAGTQGFQKSGSGTLVLTGSSSYTGFTRLNASTLVASDATVHTGATGTASVLGANSGIVTANGAVLDLRANGNNDASAQTIAFRNYIYNVTPNQTFTINVDRQSETGGTGKTISLSSSTNILSNGSVLNVTGGNGYRLHLGALNVGTGNTNGNVTLNPTSANLTIGNVTNQASTNAHTLILDGTSLGNEITGVIADNGAAGILSIAKANSSTWTFSNANTYSGGTSITAGTLVLIGNGSLGSGDVSLGANGTLDVSGITGEAFTLSSTQVFTADGLVNAAGKTLVVEGTFNPGSSPGSLDVTGGFTLGAASVSNFEITGITSGLFDSLHVTGALTFGGTLNLVTNYAFQVGDSVNLFDWGSVSGAFSAITGTDLGDGLSWDVSNLYTTGVITVVPEPASCVLVVLGGAFLMTLRRRR